MLFRSGEIFQALQTGAIDAAEWVGPYDDEKLGLQKVAEYYYYPGWWEPGPTLELQINLRAWNALPIEYREAIKTAAYEANMTMLAKYDTRNNEALERLIKSGVKLRSYSPEIRIFGRVLVVQLKRGFLGSRQNLRTIGPKLYAIFK